ncbi:MAG: 1-deoxy-D-xylulose-5-phosphate synthase [Thermodesulfovibrionales bacterium]|nr:1-deoxy-D-xylulose-5-phosphate synthase [Thermodesulfovibrionales bacterium]
MSMIQGITSPQDIKSLSLDSLKKLAEDIRSTIVERVSLNGGHLSSNLGVVELTIALHYVFDSPTDKIIWDVGHQCYAHKIITGRYNEFHSLRKHGGISGFPKRSESPHDIFGTGHSSTSISAGLGMVVARDLDIQKGQIERQKERVIAVIGDGAMTSGLAFEGLNHAGHLKKDIIVILNDNEMSISPNVGALSNYLIKIQTTTFFRKFKKETKALIEGIPKIGSTFTRLAEKAEGSLKGFFLPGGLFIDLGFEYIGPIDGHDIEMLINTLIGVRELHGPILLHIVTAKGKGYKFAEEDPCIYHGTGPFDSCEGLKNGNAQYYEATNLTYSEVFGKTIVELAEKDEKIVAITAAMKEGTGLSAFAERFPDRFFDVGIAEPHAVTFAAGLSTQGKKPVVAIYSTFLQRGYDEIIHDVCLQNLPVLFVIDRCGIVGEDGATHQGVFDISYLRHIPNIVIMSPKDADEMKDMLAFGCSLNVPCAIRFPRGKAPTILDDGYISSQITLGKAEVLSDGDDILILAVGNTVLRVKRIIGRLMQSGINPTLVNMRFIKPLDKELIIDKVKKIKRVVTIEENVLAGGFGSAVLECLCDNAVFDVKVLRIGLPDVFIEHGSQKRLREIYGLDEESIFRSIADFCKS